MSAQTPVFLLSLPRAGSTLLQRMLGSHPDIYTRGEGHFLLPFFYAGRAEGVYADYGHKVVAGEFKQFVDQLPDGEGQVHRALGVMVEDLFAAAAPDARFYLDKTPRYHLIAEDLVTAFPTARFIVQWRNPLAVAASMIETFKGGRWNLHEHHIDLYQGVDKLCAFARDHAERVHTLSYESLLESPEQSLRDVCAYLACSYTDEMATLSAAPPQGRGDPTGVHRYQDLSREPLEKWKAVMANPLRRKWCARYLDWIGEERLAIQGYSLSVLQAELSNLPGSFRHLGSDCWEMLLGNGKLMFNWPMLVDQRRRKKCGETLTWHV
jgi:hypothetical protein